MPTTLASRISIDAVRLALGARRGLTLDPADFHQLDLDTDLRVDVRLREPLKKENIFHRIDEIHGLFYRAWRGERGDDKGQLKFENYCIDSTGKTYRPPAAVPRGKVPVDPEAEPIRYLPALARNVVPLLGRVHYLTPSLFRAFATSGYGVLAQLLDLYRNDFRSETNIYTMPDGSEVTHAQAYDRFVVRLEEILRNTQARHDRGGAEQESARRARPTATGAQVRLAMPTAEELLADILMLHVQDDEASPALAVDRLGAGYRSLLRLAILRTYADLAEDTRPGVFLIEEPEAYLNPHLRRFFATTLTRLAERGNDVLLTTHDPAFVSIADYQSVIRVAKDEGRSVVYRCTSSLDFSYERIAQKLRRGGNTEVLFAQKAILCEGQDDAASVRALLDRLGIDPDSRSISVVDCGSRDNLPDYVRLLDELHIEPLVVTDGDATTCQTDAGTAEKVRTVEEAAAGRMYRFTEDIETALDTTKRGRDNTAHLVSLIETLDLDALPEEHEIGGLAQALTEFCGPPVPASDEVPPASVDT